MTVDNYSSLNSLYTLPPNVQLTQSVSNMPESDDDLLSSFKEIFSLMTLSSSMSTDGTSNSGGMSSMLMMPIMLMLVERLIEMDMDTSELSTEKSLAKPIPSGLPVEGPVTQGSHVGHYALDFGIPVGTEIETTMDGEVIYAGWNDQGYGNLVIVENGAYRTYYAHLSSIPVQVGDTVTAGTTIGLSGNTGNSTGPHLHYEIRKDGVAIDPTIATLGANYA